VTIVATNPPETTLSENDRTESGNPASPAARLLMLPIRAYRLISVHLPPRCRYHPSCSAYALEALEVHGAAKGSWLAARRIGRCHPWHDGGLDPVPARTQPRKRVRGRFHGHHHTNRCSHDAAPHAAKES
jgi:putative membrane protein insertion efficiency factor